MISSAIRTSKRLVGVEVAGACRMSTSTPGTSGGISASRLAMIEPLAVVASDCLTNVRPGLELFMVDVDELRRLVVERQDDGCRRLHGSVHAPEDAAG
jgi:hypothetical protein